MAYRSSGYGCIVSEILIKEYRYLALGKIGVIPCGQDFFYYPGRVVLQAIDYRKEVFPYPIASVEDLFSGGQVWLKVVRSRGVPPLGATLKWTFDDLMVLHLSI
jgi:hypothetical protein